MFTYPGPVGSGGYFYRGISGKGGYTFLVYGQAWEQTKRKMKDTNTPIPSQLRTHTHVHGSLHIIGDSPSCCHRGRNEKWWISQFLMFCLIMTIIWSCVPCSLIRLLMVPLRPEPNSWLKNTLTSVGTRARLSEPKARSCDYGIRLQNFGVNAWVLKSILHI